MAALPDPVDPSTPTSAEDSTSAAARPRSANAPIFEARDVTKRFGRVVALRGVNFDLRAGEVHAIVGDNGAGKSTLIKILSGVLQPTSGEILIDGSPVSLASPREAAVARHRDRLPGSRARRTISTPPRTCSSVARRCCPASSAGSASSTSARCAGAPRRSCGTSRSTSRRSQSPVLGLSGGQRQAVAVARAHAWGSRIVIMDEPTAALGVRESAMVLELIREVRANGVSVIMISHNLPETFAVADRITVVRLGRNVATLETRDSSVEAIVGMMTGIAAPAGGGAA